MPATAPQDSFSRAAIRRKLGVTDAQLRGWQRQGLIGGGDRYSFSDLIAIRTLQKLRENHIPPRQIGRAIASLKQKLEGVKQPLSELKIVSDGRTIAVQIAGQKMEAISGQLLFDFDLGELGNLTPFPPAAPHPARRQHDERAAEAWFEKGLALEECEAPVEETIAAYKKAIELNPSAAGAMVNLGTIYYRMRRLPDAESCYRQAVDADPRYALAQFNLGNLYDERGDTSRALQHYKTALRLNPSYADAHFNLALLCEKTGDPLKAVLHWKWYLKLDNSSSWAEIARRQLDKLRKATLVQPR